MQWGKSGPFHLATEGAGPVHPPASPRSATGVLAVRRTRHGTRGPGRPRAFLLISFACGFLLVTAPLALLSSYSGVPGSGLLGGSDGGSDDGASGSGGAAPLTPVPGRAGTATESSSSAAPVDVGNLVPAGGVAADGGGSGAPGGAVAGVLNGGSVGGGSGSGSGGGSGSTSTPTTTSSPTPAPLPLPCVCSAVTTATSAVGGVVGGLVP